MSDLRSFNRDFLIQFISLYKSLPALWKIRSKDYSDRNKKNAAYQQMIDKLKEVEPEATKESVTKKINSLRTSYRKEKKKVDASTRSGAATDDTYEPTLWYFYMLDFLNDQETPRQSTSNFDDLGQDDSNEDIIVDSPLSHPLSGTPCLSPMSQALASAPDNINLHHPSSSSSSTPIAPNVGNPSVPPRRMQKRKRNADNVDALLCNVGTCITRMKESKALDHYDIFGQNVTHKLRLLSNDQRIYAEKIINEALFEAELNNLNRNCYIFKPPHINIPPQSFGMYNAAAQTHNMGDSLTIPNPNCITAPGAINMNAATSSSAVRDYVSNFLS